MVRIGRLGGRKRALVLTPARRKKIASMGGQAHRVRANSKRAQELKQLTQQAPELVERVLRLSAKLKQEVAEQLVQRANEKQAEQSEKARTTV